MVETDPLKPDRPRGLLSKRDREYLLGNSDIEPRTQRDRDIRAAIRERVWNGLLDFMLLNDRMERRDTEQVLPDRPDEVSEQNAHEVAARSIALTNALEFLYDVDTASEGREHFESTLGHAISMAERERISRRQGVMVAAPEVSIRPPRTVLPQEILDKFDAVRDPEGPSVEVFSSDELLYLYWTTHYGDNVDAESVVEKVINQWIRQQWNVAIPDEHSEGESGADTPS